MRFMDFFGVQTRIQPYLQISTFHTNTHTYYKFTHLTNTYHKHIYIYIYIYPRAKQASWLSLTPTEEDRQTDAHIPQAKQASWLFLFLQVHTFNKRISQIYIYIYIYYLEQSKLHGSLFF